MSVVRRAVGFSSGYLKSLGACVYLFTVGFWRKENRQVLDRLPRDLGFGATPLQPRLPVGDLSVFLDDGPVQVRESYAVDGNVTLTELVVLASLAQKYRPRVIFEIGTFDGRTTINLAANSPEATVHTLDLPPGHATQMAVKPGDDTYINKPASGARYRGTDCESRIVQHYGDSATFDFSKFEGRVDMVFVDGAHSYDYVKSDSQHALRLLRDGRGVILWHDYGTREVTEAIDDLRDSDPAFAGLRRVGNTALAVLIAR